MGHYRLFSYNFAVYSLKDLIAFVEKEGYEVELQENHFRIKGTGINLQFPSVNSLLRLNFHIIDSLSGIVLWRMYDDLYYIPGTARLPESLGERDQELLKKHEKLFNALKRKFQMKKGEHPKAIKDIEWIRSFEKKDKKFILF